MSDPEAQPPIEPPGHAHRTVAIAWPTPPEGFGVGPVEDRPRGIQTTWALDTPYTTGTTGTTGTLEAIPYLDDDEPRRPEGWPCW
jgi:hypothetical protein